uniref:Uncharacterized protein n=1 Tax=viral metagenome TaxID=1070528 RepID=A0A6C0HUT3_9ZZZZ
MTSLYKFPQWIDPKKLDWYWFSKNPNIFELDYGFFKVIKKLKMNNLKGVLAVTTTNHPFWSNVYNKSFTYNDQVHSCITGGGYFMDLY